MGDKVGVRTREEFAMSQDECKNDRQERVEHDAHIVERPGSTGRRSRRRRRLVTLGRVVDGRWR
eukprot:1251366-Pleurochrysis_carterae.AAC.1